MTDSCSRRNAFWNHPVLQRFRQQHEACSPARVCLAFQVYLNLSEVRGWREVDLHFSEELQTPFVTGRSSMSSPLEAAYPIAVEDSLSHHQIHTLFSALRVGEQQFDRIMLAISASDSSIAYYNVSNKIVKPEPPESSDARKQQWQRKSVSRKRHVAECIESYSREQSEKPP